MRTAMMAMTTSSSMSVNPRRLSGHMTHSNHSKKKIERGTSQRRNRRHQPEGFRDDPTNSSNQESISSANQITAKAHGPMNRLAKRRPFGCHDAVRLIEQPTWIETSAEISGQKRTGRPRPIQALAMEGRSMAAARRRTHQGRRQDFGLAFQSSRCFLSCHRPPCGHRPRPALWPCSRLDSVGWSSTRHHSRPQTPGGTARLSPEVQAVGSRGARSGCASVISLKIESEQGASRAGAASAIRSTRDLLIVTDVDERPEATEARSWNDRVIDF